jgi:hypothetical protein
MLAQPFMIFRYDRLDAIAIVSEFTPGSGDSVNVSDDTS